MIRLLRLSALLLAGRRFWLLPFLPSLWLAFQAVLLLFGTRESFEPEAAQNTLIGLPTVVLAVFLGGRIIAGELDQRSLEIAYTVPGGAHRVWITKILAALLLLIASLGLLALFTYVFFTSFPPLTALYGALQAVVFYLALSMGFATLFRSEVAGAMATAAILGLNGLLTGFGENQIRISPFWNPLSLADTDTDRLLALAVQNRVGFVLAVAAIVAMAFGRAERRETMLG